MTKSMAKQILSKLIINRQKYFRETRAEIQGGEDQPGDQHHSAQYPPLFHPNVQAAMV